MKAKILLCLATAALVFTACSNDEETAGKQVQLRLTSGVEVQSRANTQTTQIVSGETVSVWVDDTDGSSLYKANQLTADGEGKLNGSVMYFPQTGNNVNIYAVHGLFATPFANGTAFPTAGQEFLVNADQSQMGTSYTNSDLLYAYSKDVARNGNPTTKNLTFYHMLSKVELAIKLGDGGPTLASTGSVVTFDNVTLNGLFTPSTSADMTVQAERAAMLGKASSEKVGNQTVGRNLSSSFDEDKIVYNEAILVPQNLSGKTLTFRLAEGGILQYTFPEGTTFESGKKYIYKITLNLTELIVTSTIVDWVESEEGEKQGSAEMPDA